jgi:AcrR family transcriptional regulator
MKGVGIGTLYRPFPMREVLVQEVYRKEVEDLAARASKLIKRHGPPEALRRWLHLFVDYLATKRLLAENLHSRHGDADLIAQTTDTHMGQTVAMLVRETIDAREAAVAPDPSDLLRALVGVATIYPDPLWVKNAKRLADVMVAGMRAG